MRITKWSLVGALISIIVGGWIGLLIYVVGWFFLMAFVTRRGLLFIQSYIYLKALRETESRYAASWAANKMPVSVSQEYWEEALAYAKQFSDGEQLPIIEAAKREGYEYRKKSVRELLFR